MADTDVPNGADAWAEASRRMREQQLAPQVANSIHSAATVNPDSAAKANVTARFLGIPPESAAAYPDDVERQVKVQQADPQGLVQKSPVLARFLTVQSTANAIHDDIPNAQAIEQNIKTPPATPQIPTQRDLFSDIATGVQHTGLNIMGAWDKAAVALSDAMPDSMSLLKMSPEERAHYANRGYLLQDQAATPDYTPQRWTGNVASGLSYAPFGLAAPGVMAGTEGTALSQHLQSQGVDAKTANKAGAAGGAILGAVNYIPMGNLAFGEGGLAFLKSLIGATAKSGAVGAGQSVAADTATSALLDQAGYKKQAEENAPSVEKAWDSALFMAGMHIGMQGLHASGVVANLHEQHQAAAAEKDYAQLSTLGQLSAASKWRERDPEGFKQFVQAATEDGHLQNVYVDGKTFAQSLDKAGITAEELRTTLPDVADQMVEALHTDGTVKIPTADYATHIAGGKLDAELLQHLKTDPEGKTYAEAKQFQQDQAEMMKEAAAKFVKGTEEHDAFRKSQDAVQNQIHNQLDELGRHPTDVNKVNATVQAAILSRIAAKEGITPEDAFAKYGAKLAGVADAKQPGYTENQGATYGQPGSGDGRVGPQQDLGTTVGGKPAAEGWAGATRIRGNTSGKPLTVYRGAAEGLKPEHFGLDALGKASGNPSSGLGVWFTTGKSEAGSYGKAEALHLDVRNPKVIKAEDMPGFDSVEEAHAYREQLRKEGYDGIIVTAKHLGKQEAHIVAFDEHQAIRPAGDGVFNQPAYHGSPHDFDKFSLDHIGTGEGAQAYGHGLYFAEDAGVAGGYHRALAEAPGMKTMKLGSMLLNERNGFDYSRKAGTSDLENIRASLAEDIMIHENDLRGKDFRESVLKMLDDKIKDYEEEWPEGVQPAKDLRTMLAAPGALKIEYHPAKGGVYKVDIPDEHVANFLHWDKPLSEQSESVKAKLERAKVDALAKYRKTLAAEYAKQEKPSGEPLSKDLEDLLNDPDVQAMLDKADAPSEEDAKKQRLDAAVENMGEILDNKTGQGFYKELAGIYGSDAEASKYLDSLGIKGIKYLDGNSRTDGEGTHNLVVFDDKIINLTHKDGKPVTAAEREKFLQEMQPEQPSGEARGTYSPTTQTIALLKDANLSTYLHETGHWALDTYAKIAASENAPPEIKADMEKVLKWFGIRGTEGTAGGGKDGALAQRAPDTWYHGTSSDVDKFSRIEGGNMWGPGFYLTDNPHTASGYATGEEGNRIAPEGNAGPNVMPLRIAPGEMLDMNAKATKVVIKRVEKALGESLKEYTWEGMKNRDLRQVLFTQFTDQKGANDVLKKAGFKGLVDENATAGAGRTAMVFDAKDISSDITGGVLGQGGDQGTKGELPKGRTALDVWHSMSLEEQRPFHEQFARGFEAYLMEGKAPSQELAQPFARIRAWMVDIYKSLRNLNVDLTSEVRGVFDRMMASEEAIEQAQAARVFEPLFTEKPAGMTAEEWANYTDLGKEATNDAIDQMQTRSLRDMKWLSNAKSKAMKDLQRQAKAARDEVRSQVEKDVNDMPVYQMEDWLKENNKTSDADKQALKEWNERRDSQREKAAEAVKAEHLAKPEAQELKGLEKAQYVSRARREMANEVDRRVLEWEKQNKKPTLVKPEIDTELLAERFGFGSGEEAMRALAEAQPRKEVIDGMTDRRMLEEHGELSNRDNIEQAANEAVHNEARAKFMATGLKVLAKSPVPARVLLNGAREAAEGAIAAKRVGDLNPRQYLAAETRANKEAIKLAPKDPQGAVQAQRAALLNNQLVKAAYDAQDLVRKALAYAKSFDRISKRLKIEPEERDMIDALLARFDFRQNPSTGPTKQQLQLTQWVESQKALGYTPTEVPDMLNPEVRMHYKDMSVEQLRGLMDTIRSIEKIGRERHTMTVDGKRMDVQEAAAPIIAKMVERGEKFTDAQLADRPRYGVDPLWRVALDRMQSTLRAGVSEFMRPDYKGNKYDLHEVLGPFQKAFSERLFKAAYDHGDYMDQVAQIKRDRREQYGLDKEWQQSLDTVVANHNLIDHSLEVPQKRRLTRGDLIGIAMHVGNESNFDKLVKGMNWAPGDIWRTLHDNMSEKDWNAAKTLGEMAGAKWSDVAAMNRRLGNDNPDKIEPRTFQTKYGEMPGWYAPISYDPIRSRLGRKMADAKAVNPADGLFSSNYYRADTTTNGSLNSRTGYTDFIDLNWRPIEKRIADTMRDLAYREALIDVHKLYTNGDFRRQFQRTYGPEEYKHLGDWLGRLVNSEVGDEKQSKLTAISAASRRAMVANGVAFRISTMLKHGGSAAFKSTGYFAGGGEKYFASRLAQMATNHNTQVVEALAKFPEIRQRARQQDRDFANTVASLFEPESLHGKAERFGHAGVSAMDFFTAVPTAHAAYDWAITEGIPKRLGGTGKPMSEAGAIQFASKVVREAHSSTNEASQSLLITNKSEIIKTLTTLHGFMNNAFGQTADSLDKMLHANGLGKPEILARTMMAQIVPAIMAGWVTFGGPNKDESYLGWAFHHIGGELAGMLPMVREAWSAGVEGYSSSGLPPWIRAITDTVKVAKDVAKGARGDDIKHPIKDTGNAAGLLLPGLGQAGSTTQFLYDEATGKQHAETVSEWIRGVMSGTAKHDH